MYRLLICMQLAQCSVKIHVSSSASWLLCPWSQTLYGKLLPYRSASVFQHWFPPGSLIMSCFSFWVETVRAHLVVGTSRGRHIATHLYGVHCFSLLCWDLSTFYYKNNYGHLVAEKTPEMGCLKCLFKRAGFFFPFISSLTLWKEH